MEAATVGAEAATLCIQVRAAFGLHLKPGAAALGVRELRSNPSPSPSPKPDPKSDPSPNPTPSPGPTPSPHPNQVRELRAALRDAGLACASET